LAEGLFIKQAVQAGTANNYEVDSAGTSDWHIGEPPDSRMRRVAAQHGLIYSHRARQFGRHDLDRFDLVVAMDRENREELLRLSKTPAQQARVHLLREYDPDGAPNASVPDPYYSGIDGFEEAYRIIERSVNGLLYTLENPQDFSQIGE
jgi:protein-tyrosine phosphatase